MSALLRKLLAMVKADLWSVYLSHDLLTYCLIGQLLSNKEPYWSKVSRWPPYVR